MNQYLRNLFQKPLAQEIVENELKKYARQLLDHQASAAYHKKMTEYYSEGLERLKRFKATQES